MDATKTEAVPGPADARDLLYGMPEIAAFLGLKVPQARHLSDTGAIPTFKLPGNRNTCARRSSLATWLAEQEAAALAAKHRPIEGC